MVQRLGKYIIDSVIADGGMARIYRARLEGAGGIDKVLALKCIQASMRDDPEYVDMLLDEARITVRMTHKNICQVYGLEHDGDTYFLAMELIDGISLDKLERWVRENRSGFPVEAAVYIIMESCAGLSYAHRMTDDAGASLGIVHRDVNPQNICISKEGEVKLIDFGIAKARRASKETQVGTIKGKFNYMSPEQARGDRVDQRTDIFALGAVLYELLSGQMLYPLSLDEATLHKKVRMAEYDPIERYVPDIPVMLKRILDKALARDVSQRFSTARDFLLALSQFFHDSCRVYDALSLSALVGHCVEEPASGTEQPLPRVSVPVAAVPSDRTVEVPGLDMSLDRSDTVDDLMEEVDNCPTALYNKAEFDNYRQAVKKQPPDVSVIDRAVDLSIEKPNVGETVMVKLDSVGGRGNVVKRTFQSLFQRMLQINEKTLYIIALVLAVIFIVIGVLVMVSDTSGSGTEPTISRATMEERGEPEQAAPAQPGRLSKEGEAEAAPARPQNQKVVISSNPEAAQIFVDSIDYGEVTPAAVSSGAQSVLLRKPFFEDRVVDLSQAEGGRVFVELVPRVGSVRIESDPEGALVVINGMKQSSPTPMSAELPMNGKATVVVSLEGYKTETQTVIWEDEKETSQTLHVELHRNNSDI